MRGLWELSKETVVKRWRWADLLDPPSLIRKRMLLISRLSRAVPSMPESEFRRRKPRRPGSSRQGETDELWQLQRKIRPFHRASMRSDLRGVLQLAADLDSISGEGLVHGDICPGNLCTDDERWYLLDWEPSFRQVKRGRRVPICTLPYIAPSERGNSGELSSLSDKVALALSLRRIYRGTIPPGGEIEMIEQTLRKLSFRESIEYCMDEKVV